MQPTLLTPDWVPSKTAVLEVFHHVFVAARVRNEPMQPRGASDKEFFAQDWFQHRLVETGYPWRISGRNTYPDFWLDVDGVPEGYEVKSLALNPRGQPARIDFDANSSIPSGVRASAQILIAFFLYTGARDAPREVHSLVLFHGDLLNDERELVHQNLAIRGFGSYGDAFIRDRKMYVFKTPFAIDPSSLGHLRLIVPTEWALQDSRVVKIGTITRTIASERLREYRVDLYQHVVTAVTAADPRAGQVRTFDVFEHT